MLRYKDRISMQKSAQQLACVQYPRTNYWQYGGRGYSFVVSSWVYRKWKAKVNRGALRKSRVMEN
jgi:hypothetical protein